MQSFIKLLLLLVVCLPVRAQVELNTTIREATVYLNGAQITRTGQITLPAGRGNIILTELTSQLDEQSVRLGATGDFTILSINPRRNFLAPPDASPELKILTDERTEVQDAIAKRQIEMTMLKEEENVIMANKQIAGKDQSISVDEIKALADYIGQRVQELRLNYLQHTIDMRSDQERLAQLNQQINELGQTKGRNVSEVVIQYQAESAVKAEFQLSYLVPRANWKPIYDMRVTELTKPAILTYGALISQTTGEDWTNIKMVLSTGNPRQQQNAPQIVTWWLNPHQALARTQSIPSALEMEEDMMLTNVMITQGERESANIGGADVSVNLTNTEFSVRAAQDIPNDGQEYRVRIEDYELPADYQYYIAPRYDQHAYLTARLTNWQQYSLLSGPVNLFFDGSYVGRSQLRTEAAIDTLVFSLGRDEGISVKRTKDEEYRDRRFLGSKIEQRRGWTISIQKNRRNKVPIIIEDQIPVSTTDQIEVTLEQARGGNYNEQTGIIRWELNLDMGKKKDISFRYKVRHPKGMTVYLE